MRSSSRPRIVWAAALLCLVGWDAPGALDRTPHIGYLYPAGGSQGTTSRITIGGQYLQGATEVHVSGEGVDATVIQYVKPLSKKQEGEVRKNLQYLRRKQQALRNGKESPPPPRDLPELPDHPWLNGFDDTNGDEVQDLWTRLFNPKRQPNAQIAETVHIELTIAPDAPPGDRELRLGASLGLTNPMCLRVGRVAEVSEQEPDSASPVLRAPTLVNGQIFPGDVDRFQLEARAGQRLQIDARARRLIPYLADAVPGWFQAILTLYDADGRLMACADDNRFHPDPRLIVDIPADGKYELEIRDAIFRGREDFVYRLAVQEVVNPSTPAGSDSPIPAEWRHEQEPNDLSTQAESIVLPRLIAGCMNRAGDIDQFTFHGRADQIVVVEAHARRQLESPVDALVKLVDASGATVAWNDDYMEKDGHLHLGPGLLTHHADAYLKTPLPKDGAYTVRMEDAQRHGGDTYTYRLRIGPPEPDFALRVTPSSLTIPAGRTLPIEIYAQRRDGFDGEIGLALVNAPPGFLLDGSSIPQGRDHIRATLTAPRKRTAKPVALQLQGTAHVDGQEFRHAVIPADNTMQAFLWRHLVPAQELLVSVSPNKGYAESIARTQSAPVRIAAGGETTIRLKAPSRPVLKDVQWKLIDPPPGLSLGKTRLAPGELIFALKAAHPEAEPGTRDNLIIEATVHRRNNKGNKRARQVSLGVLPAIPVEIVKAKKS